MACKSIIKHIEAQAERIISQYEKLEADCEQLRVERDALRELRTRHKVWWEEFTAEEHPTDEEFLADRQSERPSHKTEAREFWFATAPMWARNNDFIEAVSKA